MIDTILMYGYEFMTYIGTYVIKYVKKKVYQF